MKHAHSWRARGGLIILAFLMILQGCAAKAPQGAEGELIPITAIQPRAVDDNMELVVEGAQPLLQYTSFQLTEPLRLVVDITDANVEKFTERIKVNQGAVVDVSPSQMDNIARLEIGLTEPVETRVYQLGGKLMVEFGGAAAETAKAEPVTPPEPLTPFPVAPPQPAEEKAPVSEKTATIVSSVKAKATRGGVNVVISGNGPMKPNTFMLEGKRLVIDIPGVKSTVRPRVIRVRKGGVDKIRIGQHITPEKKVRVVLDLKKTMEYTAKPKDNSVVVALNIAAAPKPEEKPLEKAAAPAPTPRAPAPAPPPPAAEKPVRQVEPAAETLIGAGKYSGRRISLDFQDADLVNVMRLFAEVANINIILAPDVKGKVTVRMVNIPWDQAMEIILKMNGLGYVFEENILRIATQAALVREAEEELKAKEAKKKAEDLYTRVISINYSTAKAIEGTVKKSLSPRGETVVDERTNTIIVKDIARHIDEIVALIKVLDKPIPQVMIEARIVEASLNFSREIGVQWGGTGQLSAATGNPTGFTFPSSITVTGGPQSGPTNLTPSSTGNYFVNMPATSVNASAGGSVGFSFGSLNKALNLDVILSALESTGDGKVISSPRVSALDNKEAKIQQGLSIPYQSSSAASGTNVQFIDAVLSLVVTPHVTPDNKIFMNIKAQKNAPDASIIVAGSPAIRKNEATTEILLSDGETAVIGGTIVIDRTTAIDKIPFLGDIPFIGWLFTRKLSKEEKRELIIFITPKVVKQEAI